MKLLLIFLMIKAKGIYQYIFAIIIGGSLGNLFDRIYYYAVPDFIDIHIGKFHWFIFNIADIFITVGIISLIFAELFKKDNCSFIAHTKSPEFINSCLLVFTYTS